MGYFQTPRNGPKTNKTIRFSDDMIEAVEKELEGTGSNFSEFVIAAVQAALDDLKRSRKK